MQRRGLEGRGAGRKGRGSCRAAERGSGTSGPWQDDGENGQSGSDKAGNKEGPEV